MKNNLKGFSLVEVMIAAAILSAIVLVITKVSQQSEFYYQKTTGNANIDNKLKSLKYHIWKSKESCLSSFSFSGGNVGLATANTVSIPGNSNFLSTSQNDEYKKMGFEIKSINIVRNMNDVRTATRSFFFTRAHYLEVIFKNLKNNQSYTRAISLSIRKKDDGDFECKTDTDEVVSNIEKIVKMQACVSLGMVVDIFEETTGTDNLNPKCIFTSGSVTRSFGELNKCAEDEYIDYVRVGNDLDSSLSLDDKAKYVVTCKKIPICPSGQVGIFKGKSTTPVCSSICSSDQTMVITTKGGDPKLTCVDLTCKGNTTIDFLEGINGDGSPRCTKLLDTPNNIEDIACTSGRIYFEITSNNDLRIKCQN